MNYKILVSSLLFFTPALAFGALTTDFSGYDIPAEVYFSGVANGNRVNVYRGETWQCQTYATFTDPNLLASKCEYGSFTSSTAGDYTLIYQTVTDCQSGPLSRTDCCAANAGCPGDNDATFTINDNTPPSSTITTSTLGEAINMADFFLDFVAFAILIIVLVFK